MQGGESPVSYFCLAISLRMMGCTKQEFSPKSLHKLLRKWDRNLESLSDTILLGTPCNLITSRRYNSAMWVASSVLWQGMKCAIFENLSTTTIIASLPLWVLGSATMKSILTSSHGWAGTGKGVYNPWWNWLLALWQMAQVVTTLLTSPPS